MTHDVSVACVYACMLQASMINSGGGGSWMERRETERHWCRRQRPASQTKWHMSRDGTQYVWTTRLRGKRIPDRCLWVWVCSVSLRRAGLTICCLSLGKGRGPVGGARGECMSGWLRGIVGIRVRLWKRRWTEISFLNRIVRTPGAFLALIVILCDIPAYPGRHTLSDKRSQKDIYCHGTGLGQAVSPLKKKIWFFLDRQKWKPMTGFSHNLVY